MSNHWFSMKLTTLRLTVSTFSWRIRLAWLGLRWRQQDRDLVSRWYHHQ